MTMMTGNQYAKHRGVSHTAVYKAIRVGRLKASVQVDDDGNFSIDPVLADGEWDTPGTPEFSDSKARREAANARLAELSAAEREGRMCQVDDVRAEAFNIIRRSRDAILLVPPRVIPILMAEPDPVKCENLLVKELNDALAHLSELMHIPS